jgi:hypothetical protein
MKQAGPEVSIYVLVKGSCEERFVVLDARIGNNRHSQQYEEAAGSSDDEACARMHCK